MHGRAMHDIPAAVMTRAVATMKSTAHLCKRQLVELVGDLADAPDERAVHICAPALHIERKLADPDLHRNPIADTVGGSL